MPSEGAPGIPMLHGARGVRVIYNTVGTAESIEVSVRIAGPRSTVVLSGVDTPQRFEWSPHYFKEVNLVGSNAFGVEEWNGVRKHAMEHYFDLIRVQADRRDADHHPPLPAGGLQGGVPVQPPPGRDGGGEGAVRFRGEG